MKRIRVSDAAKLMGVCRRQALRILHQKQRAHPDIEIISRDTAQAKWWVHPTGLRQLQKLEADKRQSTLEERVGFLESDLGSLDRKIDRLRLRVSSLEKTKP